MVGFTPAGKLWALQMASNSTWISPADAQPYVLYEEP